MNDNRISYMADVVDAWVKNLRDIDGRPVPVQTADLFLFLYDMSAAVDRADAEQASIDLDESLDRLAAVDRWIETASVPDSPAALEGLPAAFPELTVPPVVDDFEVPGWVNEGGTPQEGEVA